MRSAPLDECSEARHRRGPQWTMPSLAAFADQTNGTRPIGPDIEIVDGRCCGLAGAGAGVVEEQQEAVITPAVLAGAVRSGQQRVHLRLVEIAEAGPVVSFEGHRPDLAAPGNQLWTSLADKGGKGVDRRQSLVARPYAASSALLDVPKKATHHVRRHLSDDELVDGPLVRIGHKRNQEAQRVAIAVLRVAREIALDDEVLDQKAADPTAQPHIVMRLHPVLPASRTSGTEGRLPSSARPSYSGTAGFH